ncbi:hypothetical protein [Microvirga massiliensis]|nr:hypothetical protein [Microvirga massiliensis]
MRFPVRLAIFLTWVFLILDRAPIIQQLLPNVFDTGRRAQPVV